MSTTNHETILLAQRRRERKVYFALVNCCKFMLMSLRNFTALVNSVTACDRTAKHISRVKRNLTHLLWSIGRRKVGLASVPRTVEVFKVSKMSENMFKSFFRVTKSQFSVLGQNLGIPSCMRDRVTGLVVSNTEALLILLRRLSYPVRLIDMQHIFNRSSTFLSRVITLTAKFIVKKYGHLLDFHPGLNVESMRAFENSLQNSELGCPMPRVIGFIDGTIQKLCSPTQDEKLAYVASKKLHGLKYQAIVVPSGLVIHAYGPCEGILHDVCILRESGVEQWLDEHAKDENGSFLIFGDQAYGCQGNVCSPFRGSQLSVSQQTFNEIMSSHRLSVEHVFAHLLSNFAFLDFSKNQKLFLQPVATMYKTGLILANCLTCLRGNQISHRYRCEPPSMKDYLNGERLYTKKK